MISLIFELMGDVRGEEALLTEHQSGSRSLRWLGHAHLSVCSTFLAHLWDRKVPMLNGEDLPCEEEGYQSLGCHWH